jgi:mRNA turnover protein 4
MDYARGGAVVDETLVMTPEEFAEFNMTYTMLEPLKKLGLTVELQHGVLALTEPYTVCSAGDVLTPEQARLLVRSSPFVLFSQTQPVCPASFRGPFTEAVLETACNVQNQG